MSYGSSWKERALKQLYPNRCPVCDTALFEESICPECRRRLFYVRQPSCMRCGKPIEGREQEYCRDCARGRHLFRQGKAVWVYQGAVRGLMYRFKYSNRRDYAQFMAQEAVKRYGHWIQERGIEVLLPIPLHQKRRRKRGYNQAECLAESLSALTGIPVERHWLIRTKNTEPQKRLSDENRRKNLKNAFQIGRNVVQWNRVLLLDDIYTTGSTIDGAAEVLRSAGLTDIYFLCICIGRDL